MQKNRKSNRHCFKIKLEKPYFCPVSGFFLPKNLESRIFPKKIFKLILNLDFKPYAKKPRKVLSINFHKTWKNLILGLFCSLLPNTLRPLTNWKFVLLMIYMWWTYPVVFNDIRRARDLKAIFGMTFSNFGYPEKHIFENESMWFKRNKNICVKRYY